MLADMAHSQSRAPRPASPTDDGHSSDASRAPSSHDPYYSNNDIRALHDIVVAAQEVLDAAPEPKPLPAAALFKAYDEVLPKYGIDPDSDHHLSTLMFRIGGEGGGGSLLDKFQAILSRMGIVLEFGDNTTVSFRTSPSNSPAYSLSRQRKDTDEESHHDSHLVNGIVDSKSPSPRNGASIENEINGQLTVDNDEQIALAIRRATLSSVMGRWRALAARRQQDQNQGAAPQSNIDEGPEEDETMEAPSISERPSILSNDRPVTRSQRSEMGNQVMTNDDKISEIRPPITSSSLGAWQSVRNAQSTIAGANIGQGKGRTTAVDTMEIDEENQQEAEVDENTAKVAVDTTQSYAPGVFNGIQQGQLSMPIARQVEGTSVREPPNYETPRQRRNDEEKTNKESDQQRLFKRAARAREIYLASKVFNHWADRTARRLERDAVARRHMIRFRCFRGWSQAPPLSEEPAVDRLRAITVVRKWQRCQHEHEEHLRAVATRAAEGHQRRLVRKALDQWCYHRLGDVARNHHIFRERSEAVSKWKIYTTSLSVLKNQTKTTSATRTALKTLDAWHDAAERGATRTDAAKQIGSVQQSYTHLREWWDQAEIGRRAKMYRQYILLKKAAFAFTQWNLQARTQAFLWRQEFQAVTRVFAKWCQAVESNEDSRQDAKAMYENRAKLKVLSNLKRQRRRWVRLSRHEERARLYIGATRLLQVLDVAVKHRKSQEKEQLKRYLKKRYTQMSSARKQRSFFRALDCWRDTTALATEQHGVVDELKMRRQSQQLALAVQVWNEQAQDSRQRYEDAQLFHVRDWVAAWGEYSETLAQQESDAWNLWATDKQRQCVKEWSISALQQSGQAHTASKIHNRYERERRNRTLQHWRHVHETSKNNHNEPDSLPALRFFPRSSYGRSWRGRSTGRSVGRDRDKNHEYQANPFETPTRWTGLALPMSSLGPGRTMDAVDEIDEEDVGSSPAGGDVGTASPIFDQRQHPDGLFNLSTTTPKAPVPTYLKRGILTSNVQPQSSVRGLRRTMPTAPSRAARQASFNTSEPSRAEAAGRSVASSTTIDRRLGSTQIARLQPAYQAHSRLPVNKSVGANPSGLRYNTPQATKPALTTRSVRIQSPRSQTIARTGRDFTSSAK